MIKYVGKIGQWVACSFFWIALTLPLSAFGEELDVWIERLGRLDVSKENSSGKNHSLKRTLLERLDPKSEHYVYRSFPQLAPESHVLLKSSVQLLELAVQDERVRAQDSSLQQRVRDDRWHLILESKISPQGLGKIRDPQVERHLARKELVGLASQAIYLVNDELRKIYELMTATKVIDQRFVSQSLFGSHLERGHRPLENIVNLSRKSQYAPRILWRLLNTYRSRVVQLHHDFARLVEGARGDSPFENGFFRDFKNLQMRFNEDRFLLEYFIKMLYPAVQFGNDVVLGRFGSVRAKSDLIAIMVKLGISLKQTLSNIENYSSAIGLGLSDQEFFAFQPLEVELSPVRHQMDEILNRRGSHLYYVMLDLRGVHGDSYLIDHYRDLVTGQYIIAAGGALAAIARTQEGRGSIGDRIVQELRYRGIVRSPPIETKVVTKIEPLGQSGHRLTRSDFVSDHLKAAWGNIEDELWQVFFQAADLKRESPCRDILRQLLLPVTE